MRARITIDPDDLQDAIAEHVSAQQSADGSSTATRVAVARSMPAQQRGKSRQNYATPVDFMRAVERRFGAMTFDLAADSDNRKASHWFGVEQDSLAQDWTKLRGKLWLNPPFANIDPWASKCSEARDPTCERMIFLLTPASIGSNWFRYYIEPFARVLALCPRLSFDGRNPYPKDCMLSIFGPPKSFGVWRWDVGGAWSEP